jgi:hypothetical protein
MLYWMQENQTATYFLRSGLFTYDIMKNFTSCQNWFCFILKVANIRCFILIAVQIFHNIVFLFVTCAFYSANNFTHAQTLYRIRSLCRSYECMNIVWVNIECFTGCKRIKQRRISFVLGYLHTNVYPHNIHTFIWPTQWPYSVKRLRMCEIVCWIKSTCHK